jgi:hypothetical protein
LDSIGGSFLDQGDGFVNAPFEVKPYGLCLYSADFDSLVHDGQSKTLIAGWGHKIELARYDIFPS